MTLLTLLDTGTPAFSLEPEAARLYQQLAPIAQDDEEHGRATAYLCEVLMKPIEAISAIAMDIGDEPGYAALLDVTRTPAPELPWLGQLNGTPLQAGEPEAEQRRKIREARGSHRGTKRAIISDLKATLTGSASVTLLERDGGAFLNTFVTLPGEMPDEAASLAALNDRQAKPLGTINTLIATTSPLWSEATKTWAEIASSVKWGTMKVGDI